MEQSRFFLSCGQITDRVSRYKYSIGKIWDYNRMEESWILFLSLYLGILCKQLVNFNLEMDILVIFKFIEIII